MEIEPPFALAGPEEVDKAAGLADEAFDTYSRTSLEDRARFLERIADNLGGIAPELADRTSRETGIAAAQLEVQAGRAAVVLRKFAAVVRAGRFLNLTIDSAQPDRQPVPRMDHRLMKVPVGPVVVFGASNFPISYSVVGGDTASALASGCPVIVKAHNAHLGSSEMQAQVITDAVAAEGLPNGVFSLLTGAGNEIGESLVRHPLVKSVCFTGSERGGMALYRIAQRREEPIPVFCEMTSVNPTFALPAALAARGGDIGRGFIERTLFNAGQACLKPAVLIAVRGEGMAELRQAMVDVIRAAPASTLLSTGIADAYKAGLERLQKSGAVVIARGAGAEERIDGNPTLLEVGATEFIGAPPLAEEVFGPSALLVNAEDATELVTAAETLRGQLSAAMHLEPADLDLAKKLLPILERRTGRIVINAFCQPQEVEHATTHGGPFPATTDSRFTSVGLSAIDRFLRPVTYQDFPAELLPAPLRDPNDLRLLRLVDGELTQE